MAKKIIIAGSHLLTDVTQDQPWGGKNEASSPITVHDTTIPPGAEWGMNRGEVERAIKAKAAEIATSLGQKAGAFRWEMPSGSNFYYLLLFANEMAALDWDADHALTNYIARHQLPIVATNSDAYALSISTSRTGSTQANPIVIQRGRDFNVPLRVLAWHYPPNGAGDPCNYDRQPSIVVERSTNGTTWTEVGTTGVTGIADTLDDATFPNIVNIGQMADTGNDGAVMIRFSIPSYVYTNASGERATMASNRVVIYLRTVTLAISMASTDWLSPIRISDSSTSVPIRFSLQGNIAKTLHVKCTNAAGSETYEVATENVAATGEYDYTINDVSGTLGTSASGVHTVTAWLTYGTGADAITSDVIVHQILVLKPSTAASVGPRVLIQQMAQTVDNFVQTELCHYFVWNPKLENDIYINDTSQNVAVRFVVADSPSLSESHTEYMTLPVSVTPGTDCTLMATMEIETDVVQNSYTARLHALSSSGTAMLTPARQFVVDNTAGFQPVSGSVFHLNPKVRNNGEVTPKSILNARNGNAVVTSVWSDTFKMDDSDGWTVDSNGEKVLRVPAGRVLNIVYNPLGYLYTAPSPSKALTIDIDFQVNNITNEEDPILRLCEPSGTEGQYLGLRLRPMVGTMGCVTDSNETTTDLRWAEGRRQHLSVTIIPSVHPNATGDARYLSNYTPQQAAGTINLVRVYLNGVIIRETRYNPNNQSEFCTGAMSNGGIFIGQTGTEGRASGADIDIYGIRVWESGLAPRFVLQNYVSSLPGSTEKLAVKAANDITIDDNSGRVSLPKACAIGKNCLIWHGTEVMYGYGDSGKEKGWIEMRRYSYSGTYLPQYSGSFCKTTKSLSGKGQGTTAMTYFYWNMQWKFGDVGWNDDLDYDRLDPGKCLVLMPSQIDSMIHLGTPVEMSSLSADDQKTFELVDVETYTHACPVYGGNLGKDEPVGTATKYYPCTVGEGNVLATVMLPDGWINGTGDLYDPLTNPTGGLYCGPCWQADSGLPYGSKHVLKINYASSMQSHLIGINWLYNELHRIYCGANSLQRDVPNAVTAKQVVPVLFFTAGKDVTDADETDGTATFRGMGGFGPGKMDKPSWGYSKKASKITTVGDDHYRPDGHDYFAMFEGAVNNSVLSDQIAPWDDTDHLDAQGNIIQRAKVKYFLHDPVNAAAKNPESFYYRRTVLQNGNEVDSWEKGIGFDAGKTGRKASDGLLYNSNSCDDPDNAPSAAITTILRNAWNYAYLHNPNIRYFNGTQDQLAAATLTEAERKRKWITRDSFLLKRWDFCERQWVDAGLWNTETHTYDQIDIADVIDASSELRDDRQAVVNAYVAHIVEEARPKNAAETDGIGAFFNAKSLQFHYVFQNHFMAGTDNCSKNTYYVIDPVTHLIELHQDDVDTTIATDNFGFQSKPYYVDRMNPYNDNDTVRAENESCYDGMLNTLFDLVECMWEPNGTLANALGSVLVAMSNLTGGIGSTESSSQGGVWRTLNRYLFDIQRYFPQVCFNEAARIRYEFPAMLGFIGRDGEADPLAQSMGDQLEAEIQFMKRRLIYMASYAGFGEFSASVGGNSGSTGISDAGAQLSVNSVALPNGGIPDQTFTVTPHQYLFPVFTWQSQTDATRHRTAPGEAFTYTTTFGFANTYPIALRGLNYYRSVGNLGNKTINADSFSIQGARLTEFIAEPTVYYSKTQGGGSISKTFYDAMTEDQKANYAPAFSRPANLQIGSGADGATRLRSLSLHGCTSTGSTPAVPLNLSRLSMVETIDLGQTTMQSVIVPQTSTLTTLLLPSTITSLSLTAQPSLATLTIGSGYTGLTSVEITGCPRLSAATRPIVTTMAGYNTQMTKLVLKHIAWEDAITLTHLRWMLTATELTLEGKADNASYDFQVTGDPTFEDVCKMITMLGDFRSSLNPIYIGVLSSDIGLVEGRLSLAGMKYVNTSQLTTDPDNTNWWEKTDAHQRSGLWAQVTDGNNVAAVQKSDGSWVPDVRWDFVTEIDGSTIDTTRAPLYADFPSNAVINGENVCLGVAPRMKILDSSENVKLVVRMRVKLTSGTVLSRTKRIGMWWRIPEVGDFAWSDGEFDNEDDASKTLAGIVIMREWLDADNKVVTDASNRVKYRLWVWSSRNATIPAVGAQGDFASQSAITMPAWGLYPDNSGANGLNSAWDAENSRFANGLTEKIRAVASQWANETGYTYTVDTKYRLGTYYTLGDPFDTPLIDYSGSHTMSQSNYQDATNRTPACKGSYTGAGDGDGYAAQSNSYQLNFNTLTENAILMSYINVVLAAVESYIRENGSSPDVTLIRPTTPVELARLLQQLVGLLGGTIGTAVARQLAFPAIRACNVWSPADVNAQATVDEQYARGKWMAPSSGLLARAYNFVGNSRTTYNSSGSPVAEKAEANAGAAATEAAKPIFANAIVRGRTIPVSVSSYHWSSTETGRYIARLVNFYNGNAIYNNKYNTSSVVRPVAAFTFVP